MGMSLVPFMKRTTLFSWMKDSMAALSSGWRPVEPVAVRMSMRQRQGREEGERG